MRVKLGPISLSFLTDVTREDVDEAGRRVRLAAKAREERGRGAADATIESWLGAAEGRTRVTTATDLALTGKAAQFGRSLVQDVTAQLLQSFADCLEDQLVNQPGSPAAPEPDSVEPRPVSGLRLGAMAMATMLERHKGLTSALWASFFFLYLWLGMVLLDVSGVLALLVAAVLGGAIFLYIRGSTARRTPTGGPGRRRRASQRVESQIRRYFE